MDLEVREYNTPSAPATSSGCHVCVVEVDVETGHVRLLRYVVAHDCGRILNPTILTGQVRGAIVHGIGEVLIEDNNDYDAPGDMITVESGDGGKTEIKKESEFTAATITVTSGGDCKVEDPGDLGDDCS